MKYSVRLMERNFSDPLITPPVRLKPISYSWHAMGGPLSADIEVELLGTDTRAIWETLEWLRCPIEIYDENEKCVWWGLVDDIEMTRGNLVIGVSLDSMGNRIAAIYENDTKQKSITSWNQDDDSVSVYGTKELILSSTVIGQTAADYYRDEILEYSKKPIPEITFGEEVGQSSARITARGWWKSLGWKYYSAVEGSLTSTTQQIANIVSSCGQFFTGTEIKKSSGISTDPFRNGDNNALFEVEALLAVGTNSGKRLLSMVSKDREVIVFEEPNLSSDQIELYIRENGEAEDIFGSKSIGATCPVGIWARLKDVIPGSLDFGILSDPSVFFVEEASFHIQSGRYIPIARGQGTPYGIGTRISEG